MLTKLKRVLEKWFKKDIEFTEDEALASRINCFTSNEREY